MKYASLHSVFEHIPPAPVPRTARGRSTCWEGPRGHDTCRGGRLEGHSMLSGHQIATENNSRNTECKRHHACDKQICVAGTAQNLSLDCTQCSTNFCLWGKPRTEPKRRASFFISNTHLCTIVIHHVLPRAHGLRLIICVGMQEDTSVMRI